MQAGSDDVIRDRPHSVSDAAASNDVTSACEPGFDLIDR
jgi:hypothetical protein